MNLEEWSNLQGNDYHIEKMKFEHYLLCVHYTRRAIMKNDFGIMMAIGLVLGAGVGVATNDMGLGMGVGLALGFGLAAQKNNKKWILDC